MVTGEGVDGPLTFVLPSSLPYHIPYHIQLVSGTGAAAARSGYTWGPWRQSSTMSASEYVVFDQPRERTGQEKEDKARAVLALNNCPLSTPTRNDFLIWGCVCHTKLSFRSVCLTKRARMVSTAQTTFFEHPQGKNPDRFLPLLGFFIFGKAAQRSIEQRSERTVSIVF